MKYIFTALSIFLFVNLSSAQSAKTIKIKQKLQWKLDSLQKANGFPGATFAAILPNGEKIQIATGLSDSLNRSIMQAEHRMLSASIGKTFFAAAVVSLVEQGKLSLDDPISKYLSSETWFERIPNSTSVTIRMLMNHTSGIEEYYGLGDFMQKLKSNPDKKWEPQETFAYVFDRKPLFTAGTNFGYSDTNYLILGYVIEKITGDSMYSLAYKYAIKPYFLFNTEPSIKRNLNKLATGYSRSGGPFPYSGALVKNDTLIINPQFEWTGGGFVSNSADLARWAKEFYHLKSVSGKLRKEMQSGVKANTGKDHLYGLGMQIRPASTIGYGYGHSGWFPGYVSDCEYFPAIDLAVAIQFNTDDKRLLKTSVNTYLLDMMEVIRSYENKLD